MTLRKRIFLIVGIVLAIILLFILFFIFSRKKIAPVHTSAAISSSSAVLPSPATIQPQATVSPIPAGTPDELFVRQLARLFVERYGSYSNQNENGQIADVLPLSTARMQAYLAGKLQAFNPAYQGATTHVVASKIISRDDAKATVHVDVQRIISDSAGSKTVYDSGTVELVKESGAWKIDGLYWGK